MILFPDHFDNSSAASDKKNCQLSHFWNTTILFIIKQLMVLYVEQ